MKRILDSLYLQLFMLTITTVDAILVGFQTVKQDMFWADYVSLVITLIFVSEVVGHVVVKGFKYLKNFWNMVDAMAVFLTLALFFYCPFWSQRVMLIRFLRYPRVFLHMFIQSRRVRKGARRHVFRNQKGVKDAGVELDLSYITDKIIVMSWPAVLTEAIYRNSQADVEAFLDK